MVTQTNTSSVTVNKHERNVSQVIFDSMPVFVPVIVSNDVTISNATIANINSTDIASQANVTYAGNITRTRSVVQSGVQLTPAVTAGVTIASVIAFTSIVGATLYYIYHRRSQASAARTQDTTSSHYTGLWDDSIMLSYINSQFDIPKDPSEEMVSLDNDAYLNSLESMTATLRVTPKPKF